MVKIITFEGTDYAGKSATVAHLARTFSKRVDLVFNEGVVYPTALTARLLTTANQSDEKDREFLYTMIFLLDVSQSQVEHPEDNRTFFQDRYWPSVITYGRFLNKEASLHNHRDFKSLFLTPDATIYLSCSYEERMRRSRQRERKSVLDKYILENPGEFARLEEETRKSLDGLPNILKIDTTNIPIQNVASGVIDYLSSIKLLSLESGLK